jgi:hypothetical protein
MATLIILMMTVVIASGLALIGTGAWYHLHRDRLQADPVLIHSCYLWGGILLVSNLAIPALG